MKRKILIPAILVVMLLVATPVVLAAQDSDGDCLSDWEEFLLGTDPYDADTDDGGCPDGCEVFYGTDPLSPDDDEMCWFKGRTCPVC